MNLSDLATASEKLRANDFELAATRRRIDLISKVSGAALSLGLVAAVCWLHWFAGGLTAWQFAVTLLVYSLAVSARAKAGTWYAEREADRICREHPVPGSREMARALGLIRDDVQAGPAVAPEKRAN